MKTSNNSRTVSEYLTRDTKSIILNIVYKNPGISRKELAKRSSYSSATITRIVETLINNDDLLEEKGYRNLPKGRPMKSLYFKGENKYAIGIDLGTTYIRGVLANLNMDVYKEVEVLTESDKSPEYVFNKVCKVIENLSNTTLVDNSKILGVGMAIAGIINTSSGIVEYSPAFNWRNVNIKELLHEKIKLPYFFDNVSRVMAFGELKYGKGEKYDNFIMINVGFGIGAGIVLNKKLFYGTDGMAGELGHVPVHGDGLVKCTCGKNTCLTAYASGEAIAKRALNKVKEGHDSIISELCEGNYSRVDAKLVGEAYEMGDSVAIETFKESTEYLGSAIASLANVFNPQAIFIGGGVSLNQSAFWDNLTEVFNYHVFNHRSTKIDLLSATYLDKAALYGSVGLVLDEVLNLHLIDQKKIA